MIIQVNVTIFPEYSAKLIIFKPSIELNRGRKSMNSIDWQVRIVRIASKCGEERLPSAIGRGGSEREVLLVDFFVWSFD
jgi:hypothetical protein